MPADYISNRKTQKQILIVSLLVIAWGLYDMFSGQFYDLVKPNNNEDAQIHKNIPLITAFLVALVMAFFSARNLLRREGE